MKLWPVALFFSVIKKMKKGATGQSFIPKEVTSYKIHTLEGRAEIFVIFG